MFTQKKVRIVLAVLVFIIVVFMTGCGGAYKASGQYKRDLLLDRIEKASQCHERAKNQFEVVLANYSDIIDANAGDIRTEYNKLNRECERARKLSKEICKKVKDVEDIAKPLFRSWEDELAEYKNEGLRRSSEEQLDNTRRSYFELVHSIKATEGMTEDVLALLNDQVLFLSHNLNTKALAAYKKEVSNLKLQVKDLINHMQKAIQQSETFVDENGSVVLTKLEE
ncbi:MAG: DUF2959 domain-containing protein [Phycisphaerae bacterium]|nr:DUF2959 domain-containing protein [Phycisphaerae bacterium]